jgi:diadenosine tetraphosphatase ApaH/serine/threonine PP2A family protein phosphatase
MAQTDTAQHPYDGDASLPARAPATPDEWDDLIRQWDEIRHGYHLGDTPRTVLECAGHLQASVAAGGPDTALWTLGLVLTGPYVIYARPDAAAEARVLEAMDAVERALGRTTCAHEAHPCDDMPLDAELDNFRYVLEMLAHPERDAAHEAALADDELWSDEDARNWYERLMTREIWTCPRNLAGFARAFSD